MSRESRRAARANEHGIGRGMTKVLYLLLAGGAGLLIKENQETVSNVPLMLQGSGVVLTAASVGIIAVEYRDYKNPDNKRKERAGMVAGAFGLLGGLTVMSLSANLANPFQAERGDETTTKTAETAMPADESFGAQVARSGDNISIILPSFVTGYGCSIDGETFPHTARWGETTLSIISKAFPGGGAYTKEQKDAINDALIAANPSANLHQIWADRDVFMVSCPQQTTTTTAAFVTSTTLEFG